MSAATAVAEKAPNKAAALRVELGQMEGQFKAALPAHIPVERFMRVVMTAIQQNPELLEVNRRSLWNAAIKAAQDGLLPDGREGAMVVRADRQLGKTANWMPMIAGVRKKVRNSGEIADWNAHVVYANDEFDYQLGDDPFIHHKPTLDEPGPAIAAYSVAVLKSGEKSREVMPIHEIYKIRDRSDGWKAFKAGKIKSTPWASDEGEMIRKTVARRHSKVLPMSTDLDDLIRRDDELYQFGEAAQEARQTGAGRPRSLAGRLDALASAATATMPAGDQKPSGGEVPEHDPETGEIIDGEATTVEENAATVPPGAADAEAQPKEVPADASAGVEEPQASRPGEAGAAASTPNQPRPSEALFPADLPPDEAEAEAFKRGYDSISEGTTDKAVPGEYRLEGKERIAQAWRSGRKRALADGQKPAKGGAQ